MCDMKPTLPEVIEHARNREYMSGVARDKLRVKATAEIFTPTPLAQHMIESTINQQDLFDNFLDPSCGDGQLLSEILIAKMKAGMDFESALSTIYGVDLMQDNVDLCRERLLCGCEELRSIVNQNIVCADALKYHYRFDGSPLYDTDNLMSMFE